MYYEFLYSIRDENLAEIKISPGVLLLICQCVGKHIPVAIMSVEDGEEMKPSNLLVNHNKGMKQGLREVVLEIFAEGGRPKPAMDLLSPMPAVAEHSIPTEATTAVPGAVSTTSAPHVSTVMVMQRRGQLGQQTLGSSSQAPDPIDGLGPQISSSPSPIQVTSATRPNWTPPLAPQSHFDRAGPSVNRNGVWTGPVARTWPEVNLWQTGYGSEGTPLVHPNPNPNVGGNPPPWEPPRRWQCEEGPMQVVQPCSIRLEIPKYAGRDPLNWLHRAEKFFRFHGTPENLQVQLASFHLEGVAGNRFEWRTGLPFHQAVQ